MVGETGCLAEAAVEGLMSWVGEGWRFMLADCSVDASSMAGLDILNELMSGGTSDAWRAVHEVDLDAKDLTELGAVAFAKISRILDLQKDIAIEELRWLCLRA